MRCVSCSLRSRRLRAPAADAPARQTRYARARDEQGRMRECAALLLFATAAATPFECPSGGRDDAWPTADDAARFLRVLEESRRAADHHAYFAARGADATEARRRHGQEVLRREGNAQVLDDVEGDGVAMVVVGQARFVASDAYVASLRRVAAAAGDSPEVVAVLAAESTFKGCQRRTATVGEAAARAALARGVGAAARVRLRWVSPTNASAFDAEVVAALRALAPPLGVAGVAEAFAALVAGEANHAFRQYGKFLLAYDELRAAEAARGRPFAAMAFLRPDTIYGGFDAAKIDAWTAHVVNDQFAVVGRPLARVYLSQVVFVVRFFTARRTAGACGRLNALLAELAPQWGWDALFRGASLHLASYGVVHSGLDVGLKRMPRRQSPKLLAWHVILRLAADGEAPCLNHLVGKPAEDDARGAERFARAIGLPAGALACGCPVAAPPR